LLKRRFPAVDPLSLSLALTGLMWVLPFVHYRHQYPLTTFYQEWWSALFGVLALIPFVLRGGHVPHFSRVPRIVLLPLALCGVVLLQFALGKIGYFDQALLYLLYFLLAAALMQLGAMLRLHFGMPALAAFLAIALLIGSEAGALLGILQHFRWSTPLDPVLVMKISAAVYGNLAQPNHYANYLALGLISLGLLSQQKRLRPGAVVLLAFPLLLTLTLSGSRSSWLYLLMLAGLSWWWARRDSQQQPLFRYSLLLIAAFVAMHGLVRLPFMQGADAGLDTLQRLFAETATGSIRLYLWQEAVQIFIAQPWLGAGFGQFAWQHFQLQPGMGDVAIQGLYNNAHNLILQMAAEAGLAGLIVLLLPLALWLYALRRMSVDVSHWWGLALLGVLAIHSLLEYPLWYVFFLGIAALLLGALDQTHYTLSLPRLARGSAALALLLGAAILLQLRTDYQHLERASGLRVASATAANDIEQQRRTALMAAYTSPLLSPYTEFMISGSMEISPDRLQQKLALNTRVLHFIPVGTVAYRQALLLAQNGQLAEAQIIMAQALHSYPEHFARMQPRLAALAEKDPAHFSALLEFALQKKQEL
jgi:O-antigen ligase